MKNSLNIVILLFIAITISCQSDRYKSENKILNFWTWFNQNKTHFEHINDNNRDKKLDSILQRLNVVEKGLFVEVSDEFEGGRSIIISAGGDKDKFPMVKEIVKQAPPINGWTVTAFRQRANQDFTLRYQGLSFTPSKMLFRPEKNKDTLNIAVYLSGADKHNHDSVAYYGIIAMDDVLGEYDSATKVGTYTFHDLDKTVDKTGLLPVKELPGYIDKHYKNK